MAATSLLTARPAFKAILGFFTLLWFTWLQTILYDVRFSSDSFFHQAHKAISCAVMLAFVSCAAVYDTSNVALTHAGLKYMSFVLMASRLALFIQYGIVFSRTHGYSQIVWPFILTMGTYLVTAAGFLGVALGARNHPRCYLAWSVFSLIVACRPNNHSPGTRLVHLKPSSSSPFLVSGKSSVSSAHTSSTDWAN